MKKKNMKKEKHEKGKHEKGKTWKRKNMKKEKHEKHEKIVSLLNSLTRVGLWGMLFKQAVCGLTCYKHWTETFYTGRGQQ